MGLRSDSTVHFLSEIAKYYKACAEEVFFSREIFRLTDKIKKMYLPGEIEKQPIRSNQTNQNAGLQHCNENLKIVELSFYFYFARNLFRVKHFSRKMKNYGSELLGVIK